MRITQKWIFPILRLIIVGIIAVALVRFAFFAGDHASDKAVAEPTGQLEEPQVEAVIGTVTNTIELQGDVQSDEPISLKSSLAGTVARLLVAEGQAVAAGETIATVVSETPREPTVGPGGEVVEQKPLVKSAPILATAAGSITGLSFIVDQAVEVGDVVAKVAPPSFHLTAPLTAAEQYRLVDNPHEATVTIAGGPAPFACTGLAIASSVLPMDTDASDATDEGTGQSVTCAVPAGVKVFAGLTAKVTIASGVAKDVLTVPLTAIEGAAGKGIVHLVDKKGAAQPHDVALGINDGKVAEIKSGLAAGQKILQFVPGAKADGENDDLPPGCVMDQATGETVCD